MQNEALVALAIASAIDKECMQDTLREAQLLPTLQKMLDDPLGAVEVKFSALGLVCSLAHSSDMKDAMLSGNMRDSLRPLTEHASAKLASQAQALLSMLEEGS